MDFNKIEKKWQKRWEEDKVFEPEINKKKKFFVSFPYPYINLSPHMGHFFTIMRVEAFARYKRAQGYNVLFPQGWHCTGSPIVSAAERVKEKEPKIIENLKKEGFTLKEIEKFVKPEHWIKVFGKKWFEDLKAMGLSIDWRRNFITTSLNPHYDKFIQWQFNKLREKGYVAKGDHPVVWDPKTNMPVGDHDRIEGEGETPQDFIWIKYRLKDSDLILMAGTTRPDALFGQSNLWIDPKGDYVVVQVEDEKWVVGKKTVYKIENQYKKAKIIRKIEPKELIGKWVQGPLVDRELYTLPAWFIDSSIGSGIVYSALEDPVDLYELEKIQENDKIIKEYKLNEEVVKKLKPIDIIDVPGMGKNLGLEIGREFSVNSAEDTNKLEKAKGELNKRVFRKGIMNYRCGEFKGKTVPETQEVLKKELPEAGDAVMFYELTGKVVSRSLTECVVKVVSDQWFIRYGDENWKKEAHKALSKIKLYPETPRVQFNYVIDWLNDWACTREYGLGTRLPFDKNWLIESLSDSTIYMAYYTIAHLIKEIPIEKIDDKFFDYIFLGKGTKQKIENIDNLKKEFEYWYPLDFRNSGKDLIQNHLTFFIFNHIAIFPEKYWPRAIGTNGWVRVNGQKMSKSLGNMIPLKNMAQKFGADASRLTILNGGEGMDDPNWDSKFASNLSKKFDSYQEIIKRYKEGQSKVSNIDKWMKNKLAYHVDRASRHMESTLFRSAIQDIYFELVSDIKWYLRRTDKPNSKTLNEVIESWIILMQPLTPHLAEELWSMMGKKTLVSLEKWPEYKIEKCEDTEAAIKALIYDLRKLIPMVRTKPKKAFIYTIPKELDVYSETQKFISGEVNLEINIYANNDKNKHDPQEKAKKAKFGKPAVYLE